MVTEVPVFLALEKHINLAQFKENLLQERLAYVKPYPAVFVDNQNEKNGFCFNIEGANQQDIVLQLQIIKQMKIGKMDFASIKFCGRGIHCCFAVVHQPLEDVKALTIGYINDTDFSAYLMRRNKNITYFMSFLKPQLLEKLDYTAQFYQIKEWRTYADYLLKYLNAGSVDFMQVGYYPL